MEKTAKLRSGSSFEKYIVKKLPVIIAFLIPVVVLFILYVGRGIYPYGTNMYLRSDMYHQYAPFMKEFQRNLQEGGSLLYSWNIGLGTNFASTYAYYLASPANWLVALFPNTLIPEFMNIMIILKSGLMSAVFTYYLIRKFKRNDYIATAFGCFYAMSAYMAAFSWNLMWIDCLVLLPLIMMGLEALVREGKSRMYVITLAVSIISNYYISIMICIFLVFYFIYLMICESRFEDKREAFGRILRFVIYSAIAGGIAMFIALPALFNLFITASSGSSFPSKMTAYYSILEMFAKSVINTETAVFSGHFPNIYSTMAVFGFVPLFWLSKRVPVKEKVGKTLLISLLAFSFMFNIPTFIWHGFHFPNSLPCRYSFIYILLVLVMSYQALVNIRRFNVREIVMCCMAGVAGVFILQALYPDDFTVGNACLGAVYILLYLVIALMLKNRKASKVLSMVLLMIVAISEIIINTNNTGYSTTSRTLYMSDNEAIASMLESVDDGSFYRVEKVKRRTKNDGTWNDYNSASIFSSTTVAGNSDLYSELGMQGRTNAYSYYGHTPFTQALLGVKYEIASESQNDRLMTLAASYGEYYLYENKYVMSLGFMVNNEIYNADGALTDDPFVFQNEIISKACGAEDIFYIEGSYGGGSQINYTAAKSGRLFAYLTSDQDSINVEILRNGESVGYYTFDNLETPEIVDIGDVQQGDEVYIHSNDDEVFEITADMALMDYDRYDAAMTAMKSSELKIAEYNDTYVKGYITAADGQTMFTTIPYDTGWTVYVDGEKVEYDSFEDSFILVDLEAGAHTVEFKYEPRGFKMGIAISAAALAAFVLLQMLETKRKTKNALVF